MLARCMLYAGFTPRQDRCVHVTAKLEARFRIPSFLATFPVKCAEVTRLSLISACAAKRLPMPAILGLIKRPTFILRLVEIVSR